MPEEQTTARDTEWQDDLPDLVAAVGLMAYTLDKGPWKAHRASAEDFERYLDNTRQGPSILLRVPMVAAWRDHGAECVVERSALVLHDGYLNVEVVLPWRGITEIAAGVGAVLRVRSASPRWRAAGHDGWFAVTLQSAAERTALAEAIESARGTEAERFAEEGREVARLLGAHPTRVTTAERLALMLYYGLGAELKRPSWEEAARALDLSVRDAEAEVSRHAVLTAFDLRIGRRSPKAGARRDEPREAR